MDENFSWALLHPESSSGHISSEFEFEGEYMPLLQPGCRKNII